MGAYACIGQGCCVNPAIILAVQDRFEAGDLRGAMDAQRSVNYLVKKVRNSVEFLKRYATEKGFPVKPYARAGEGTDPYAPVGPQMSAETYEATKAVLEAELAKYTQVAA
jgi:hypothetical protein